jgi:hypothetical protein
MGLQQVVFEIPPHLQTGLLSGVLERVGGVVRDSATKQVVAWLREGNFADHAASSIIGLVSAVTNPIGAVLQIAQTGLSLWDGHQTRQAVEELSKQVGQLSSQVAQFAQLTMTGQMINLAMSGVSFVLLMKRLEVLRKQIDDLSTTVQKEFKRDRDNTFQVGLEAAEDAWNHKDKNQRDFAARSAIDSLKRSRNDLLLDFQEIMNRRDKDAQNPDHLKLAQFLLQRAIFAQIAIARCYWVTDNPDTAVSQISEQLPKFKAHISGLIQALFLPSAAMYFEASIPPRELAQFLEIQHWLRDEAGPISAQSMFSIINDLRSDFFKESLFGNPLERMSGSKKWRDQQLKDLSASLALMENYKRLEGYALEIRTANLSLPEWENLVDAEKLLEFGGAIVLDELALQESMKRLI